MSYDLMVFDPEIAPRDRAAFMAWYRQVTRWDAPRDYAAPTGMTGNLPLFYAQMRKRFPPMNGPDAADIDAPPPAPARARTWWQRLIAAPNPPEPAPVDEARLTDYSFADHAIYLGFAWSMSGDAYNTTFNTALSTGVGFFDVSANEGAILHEPPDFDRFMGL